jgi:nicotinate phosphoribosyltransferase
MTFLDHKRLTNPTLRLDVDGLRRGDYSDKYFENIVHVLEGARAAGYTFSGTSARALPVDPSGLRVGDIQVEAQIFNRRAPFAIAAGVDVALNMLRHVTGYYDGDTFVETWDRLEVEAVEDGVFTHYEGDSEDVEPVIKVRGCYRDFALLETPILGVLTRASRIATSVYEVLKVANGKPVLFFPARFDLPEVQAADGYAYWLAVERYNHESGHRLPASVSTDAQARWWGGRGGGTIPHALIACYLGDTTEAMLAFATHLPVEVPRIVLADFNNDVVSASLDTLNAFWPRYRDAYLANDAEGMRRWTLYGVRLDTSANMRDASLEPDGPTGVNEALVYNVRRALDGAWTGWDVENRLLNVAEAYCRSVKIVVTGGFHRDRVAQFERDGVPVDVYGVGSTFLRNDPRTNTDYTMDIVRVLIDGHWAEMAKTGRKPGSHPDLKPVNLADL